MKRKLRLLALCSFVITALLLGASPALAAEPVLPHAFYGTVAIGDNDAPVNSVVSAEVGGVDCGSYSIDTAGRYGNLDERDYLIVQGDISNGDTITFYVNGVSTGQIETFEAGGGPTMQDLTVAETAPSLVTSAATSRTRSQATLNGSVANFGTALSAYVSFEWGTTEDYGNETTTQAMTSTGSFSFSLTGLDDDTTYHFRAKAVGHDTSYGADITFNTKSERAPSPAAPPTPPAGTTDVSGDVDPAGVFSEPVTATSDDELCTLTIPEETVGLTEELEPLDEITILREDDPPKPPKDADIVLAYDLGPDGATFEPAITLTFSYDPADIPEGKDVLAVAYYDEIAEAWIYLEGEVDTVTKTITVSISHFTTFAVIGREPAPAPPEEEVVVPLPEEEEVVEEEPEEVITVTPAPADFSVSNLTVQPAEVQPNERVTISVSVANTGGTEGSYNVVLLINDVKEAEKSVTIAVGRYAILTFNVTGEEAGIYTITVDGLSGSFTVVLPVEPPGVNWPLIGGIIAAVIIVGLGVYFLVVRRRAY